MYGCSFTGHRVIPTEHVSSLENLVERAIEYAYEKGCRCFYAGGALGFDTMCAKRIIRFRLLHPDVKFVLVLPCKDQSQRWSERQKDLYECTLGAADEIIYTSEEYSSACMKIRNQVLVDKCDMLIAYVQRDRSGASQTLAMAKKAGKEVYNLFAHVKA